MISAKVTDTGSVKGNFEAIAKQFKLSDKDRAEGYVTGSRGFFTMEKVVIDGKQYQAQIQLVETHSKAKAPPVLPAGAPNGAGEGVLDNSN